MSVASPNYVTKGGRGWKEWRKLTWLHSFTYVHTLVKLRISLRGGWKSQLYISAFSLFGWAFWRSFSKRYVHLYNTYTYNSLLYRYFSTIQYNTYIRDTAVFSVGGLLLREHRPSGKRINVGRLVRVSTDFFFFFFRIFVLHRTGELVFG